uniref:hypothetical protein n=1 Tax=Acinetobacter ursingii TaxID=108980 RepID=UPI001E2E67A2|nr:hypothetical protein [Acinetobacter ursingii]
MDDKLEFYLDAKDILSQPTSCQAQGDYKKALEKEITEHRIAKMEISPLRGNYDLDHLSKIMKKSLSIFTIGLEKCVWTTFLNVRSTRTVIMKSVIS